MQNEIIIVKFNENGFCTFKNTRQISRDIDREEYIKNIQNDLNVFVVTIDGDYYLKDNVPKLIPPNTGGANYYFNIVQEKWLLNTVAILRELRTKRNKLLSDSDYIELPSIQSTLTEEKKLEWSIYRQALRDITEQLDLLNIVWPTKP